MLTHLDTRTDHNGKEAYQVYCTVCRSKYWVRSLEMAHVCRPAKKPPTAIKQISNYVASTVTHITTGAQLREPEQIKSAYEACSSCEHFRPRENNDGGTCGLCGCNLFTSQSHLTNKIARATEHCPIGKW